MDKYLKISQDLTPWGLQRLDGGQSHQLVLEKGSSSRCDQAAWMSRTSNIDPRIRDWIRDFNQFDDDNCTYVLVAPLGSDESWGQTINGDCFSRWSLADDDDRYGYKTFMSDGRAYMHHRNTDPRRSFGDFPISVFNEASDRVEAVWRLYSDQAAKIPGATRVIESYRSGKDFPISMGCKVPYDVCSVCGNKAKNPSEYCIHPHEPGFGHIYPADHPEHALVLVRVFNPWPKFMDLSGVSINAAPEATPLGWIFPELVAHMKAMTKTSAASRHMVVVPSAYVAAYHHGLRSGMPSLSKHSMAPVKVSEMVKHIPVLESQVIEPMIEDEKEMSEEDIDGMLKKCAGVRGFLSNMGALGIALSPREFRDAVMLDQGLPRELWPEVDTAQTRKGFCEGGASFVDDIALRGHSLIGGIPLVPSRSILYPHMARRAVLSRRKESLPPVLRRGIQIEVNIHAGPTVGLLYGKYLRDLAMKMGALVQELLKSFPEVGDDLIDDGQPVRVLGASGAVKTSELAAQALIPSAYILKKASCLDREDLLMESVRALNIPGVSHFFGGVITQ